MASIRAAALTLLVIFFSLSTSWASSPGAGSQQCADGVETGSCVGKPDEETASIDETSLMSIVRLKNRRSYTVHGYCDGYGGTTYDEIDDDFEKHCGAFMKDVATSPPDLSGNNRRRTTNYYVLGGAGVDGGTWPSSSTVATTMTNNNLDDGLDFDMEGDFLDGGDNASWVRAESMKDSVDDTHSSAKFDVTILGSDDNPKKRLVDDHSRWDSVNLMLYAGSMDPAGSGAAGWGLKSSDLSLSTTNSNSPSLKYLKQWLNTVSSHSTLKAKLKLGMTTTDLKGWMVTCYKRIISNEGLAGLFIWNADSVPSTLQSCIKNSTTTCPTDGYTLLSTDCK